MPHNTAKLSPEQTPAARLARLFECGPSHTRYWPSTAKRRADGKIEVRYAYVHRPLTPGRWRDHFNETADCGIAVAPDLPDDTASWGAIDVDVYGIDAGDVCAKLAGLVEARGVSAHVVRSKSGGPRVLVFFDQQLPVSEVAQILRAVCRMLNVPDTEIFPSGSRSPGSEPGCVNVPYCGYRSKLLERQVGIRKDGSEIGLPEFVRLAERGRMGPEERARLLAGAPPPRVITYYAKQQTDPYLGPLPDEATLALMQRDAGRGTVDQVYDPDEDPLLKVQCALAVIPAHLPYRAGRGSPSWYKVARALIDNFEFEDGFPVLQNWCETSPTMSHQDAPRNRAAWERLSQKRKAHIGLGTIYGIADEYEGMLDPPPDETWRQRYRRLLEQSART